MNILEALKSGKPLRRKDCQRHMGNNGGWLRNSYIESMLETDENLRREDFFADDWEVNPGVTPERKVSIGVFEQSIPLTFFAVGGIESISVVYYPNNITTISNAVRLPHLDMPKSWKP